MKIKATVDLMLDIDETDFNPEKVDNERKNRYNNVKKALQENLEILLEDEFDSINVRQVKIECGVAKPKT